MVQPATKAIRQALITRLKSIPAITAIVPAERIYPQQIPSSVAWPYLYAGVPISTPLKASCMDGRVVRLALHGWARTTSDEGSGETQADDIADYVAEALDGSQLDIDGIGADINWISNTTIRDGQEASQFHSICQIEISLPA